MQDTQGKGGAIEVKMPLEVPLEVKKQEVDGGDSDNFQQIFADIAQAQGKLGDSANLNALKKHIQGQVYPLMSRVLGLTADMRDAFRELAQDVDSNSGGIPAEDAQFILEFLDAIGAFILRYAPTARTQAVQGSLQLQQELGALHQGATAVRNIVNDLAEEPEVVVVEEVKV